MKIYNKYKVYLFFVIGTLLVGFLSSLLTFNSMNLFNIINKSLLTPPAYIFPIVWTILYILMGISAAIIYESRSCEKKDALLVYGIQLFVNFFWSLLFFNLQAYLFAFFWLLLLLGLIIVMTIKFYQINETAAYLQISYLLWVAFAGYLNFMVYILNR